MVDLASVQQESASQKLTIRIGNILERQRIGFKVKQMPIWSLGAKLKLVITIGGNKK